MIKKVKLQITEQSNGEGDLSLNECVLQQKINELIELVNKQQDRIESLERWKKLQWEF